MKKKLLLACVVFGMNATAQKVTVKGHYKLNTYKYSKEYCEHNGLDWNYFKNQIKTSGKDGEWVDTNPNIQLVWAPKYFMYNQDTIVLTRMSTYLLSKLGDHLSDHSTSRGFLIDPLISFFLT